MATQLANTIQADIGQMPSSRNRHIGPMRVTDLRPSGIAPLPWSIIPRLLYAVPMLVPNQLVIGRLISSASDQ